MPTGAEVFRRISAELLPALEKPADVPGRAEALSAARERVLLAFNDHRDAVARLSKDLNTEYEAIAASSRAQSLAPSIVMIAGAR